MAPNQLRPAEQKGSRIHPHKSVSPSRLNCNVDPKRSQINKLDAGQLGAGGAGPQDLRRA